MEILLATSAYLIALLAVVLIGGTVLLLVRQNRRTRQRKQALAARLGFTPYAPGTLNLEERIIELHTISGSQRLCIEHAFVRTEGEATFLLFDLVDTSESGSVMQTGGLAVHSPRLELPRFSLYPKVVMQGTLARLANRFLQTVMQRRGGTIDMQAQPRFDERYFLLGPDPDAVRNFLDPYRLSFLSQHAYRAVEAGGEILTYGRLPIPEARGSGTDDLQASLAEIRNLYQAFQSKASDRIQPGQEAR